MAEFIWISDNKKWAIRNIEKDEVLSFVTLLDVVKRKVHHIEVEHIRVGAKLLDGTLAIENSDTVLVGKNTVIPKYLEAKIIELTI